MRWHDRSFAELSVSELYAIITLREAVFVVEQACIYPECDGTDRVARHLWATPDDADDILAYLRIIPAGEKFAELAIGRVLVAPAARGTGLGRELMERGIVAAGPQVIRIGAQVHLERFYASLGFRRESDVYDDHGIPHIEMLRPATPPR